MAAERFENILVEAEGAVTRISVNRPKVLNALNQATLSELTRAIDQVRARVVILTGAGDRAFIAGADISEMTDLPPTQAASFSKAGHLFGAKLEAAPFAVIAEVNGFALGGGCELMMCCDFVIASEKAKFGQPEVGLGVTPGFGGTTRLSRRVGPGWARRLAFTGETLSAAEALRIGLVTEVVSAADLRARVDALAAQIAKNAPFAVASAKRSLLLGEETDLATANRYEQEIFAMCFSTADQKEGMRAFVEKRPAKWSDA